MNRSEIRIEIAKIGVKISTAIILFVGFILSLGAVERSQNIKFWEAKLQIYSELLEYSAIIATENYNSTEFAVAKREFLKLYYGKSQLVETVEVKVRILEFNKLLSKISNGNAVNTDILQKASLDLADACRNSLAKENPINEK